MITKKIIGLKHGTVKLKTHNQNWKKLFDKEKKIILKMFPGKIIEINHAGSTAIPGIKAKPIIDIFATIKSLSIAKLFKKNLERIGYIYKGNGGVAGRIIYMKENNGLITHHLQFVKPNSSIWKNQRIIKEYFLNHKDEAKKYEKLKTELAKKFPDNREKYTKGKDKFIKSIIKKSS